jgi:ribosome-associated toxin RatA of RatAB toxin-antitoxin module
MINYSTKQVLRFPIGLFYRTVVDVRDYKGFVPWCTDSWQDNVKLIQKDHLKPIEYEKYFRTNLPIETFKGGIKVGFSVLDFSYVSTVYTQEPNVILSTVSDSQVFERLESLWVIKENKEGALDVEYTISFGFKNLIFSNATTLFLDFIGKNIVQSFIDKCNREIQDSNGNQGAGSSIEDIVNKIPFDSEQERLSMVDLFEKLKGEMDVETLNAVAEKLKGDNTLVKRINFLSELMINDSKTRIIKELKGLV